MLFQRIINVFKLSRPTFREIENDPAATQEAAIVVALVALLSVIGSLFSVLIGGQRLGGAIVGLIFTFIITFVNWIIWAVVTYFVGTNLFKGDSTMEGMARVIGYAYAPQLLGIIPCIGTIIGAIWSLVASVIGIQEALDFDLGKAIITVIIGWVIILIISSIIGTIFGVGAIGLGGLTGAFN